MRFKQETGDSPPTVHKCGTGFKSSLIIICPSEARHRLLNLTLSRKQTRLKFRTQVSALPFRLAAHVAMYRRKAATMFISVIYVLLVSSALGQDIHSFPFPGFSYKQYPLYTLDQFAGYKPVPVIMKKYLYYLRGEMATRDVVFTWKGDLQQVQHVTAILQEPLRALRAVWQY